MFLVLGKLKTDFRAVIVDNCELLVKRRLERLLVALPYECRRHPLGLESHWSKQKKLLYFYKLCSEPFIFTRSILQLLVLMHRNRQSGIQLFRQRLSHKSVKAFATMPISVMGSKRKAFLD